MVVAPNAEFNQNFAFLGGGTDRRWALELDLRVSGKCGGYHRIWSRGVGVGGWSSPTQITIRIISSSELGYSRIMIV